MFSKEFLEQLEPHFQARMERVGGKRAEIEAVFAQCTADEAEALKCLYAAMPISDAADYSPELFLAYAKHGVYLWYEGPFAGKVPEDIFVAYVLYHRLSSENITNCRPFFYNILKDNIAGMNMEQAAIELNYWCASEVTYQSTDPRTAGPETLYKSGYGRCGEESIFGAVIFRSMGIPARQAFTPLWAHCNDNHAWVEVWCDGEWKFLGACEPEPMLNKGWFSSPSSRAMVILANWHLPVVPKECVLGRDGSVHVVNRLSTYAETTHFEVNVVDKAGNPMPNVNVSFAIFNFGMFGNIASVVTDENGKAVFETGFGTLLVSIYEEGVTTELFVNTIEQSSCTIVAGTVTENIGVWEDMTTIAPVATSKNFVHMTPDEIAAAKARMQAATDKRLAKVAAFYDEELAEKAIEGYSEDDKVRCREIMKKACANQKEIAAFLAKDTEGKYPKEWKLALLNTLRDKDYVDVTCDFLEENCILSVPYADMYDKETFERFVLCPKVIFEHFRSYRPFILNFFSEEQKEEFRKNPAAAWEYVKGLLKVQKNMERGRVITSAEGALTTGYGNEMTAKVVCIQILRTLGVAAKFSFADFAVEAWKDGKFVTLEKREDNISERTAVIRIHETEGVEWRYHDNWMIARYEKGGYRPIRLPWRKEEFNGTIQTFPGKFRVMTANRLPNGNCLIKKLVFEVKDGETMDLYLQQAQATLNDMLDDHKVNDFALTREDGSACMASELVKDQKGLFIWLEESKEPTEHVLNEMYDLSESFQNLKYGKVYFIIKEQKVKEDPTLKRTLTKISNVEFLYDDFGKKMEQVAMDMHKDPGELPLIAVLDENMTALYGVAGYNVGAVNMVLRVLDATK